MAAEISYVPSRGRNPNEVVQVTFSVTREDLTKITDALGATMSPDLLEPYRAFSAASKEQGV
jgi:hypothetical protein